MKFTVEVCRAFALTVSVKTTEIISMHSPHTPRTMVRVEGARQIYIAVQSFTLRGGDVTESPDVYVNIARRTLMLDAHQTVST